MHNVMIPTPPGTASTPDTDRMEAMCRATIPTLPAGAPAPQMDRMVAMCNATIPTPPACLPAPQIDRMVAMQSVAIPIPPVASAAFSPQSPPLNNLERMKIAVIPIPPSAAPAPNRDQLEQMHNATIPQVPLMRIEMMDAQPQPSSLTGDNINQGEDPYPVWSQAPNMDRLEQMHNATIPQVPLMRIEMMDVQPQPSSLTGCNVDHPQQSTSIEVMDGWTQPSAITGDNINQGKSQIMVIQWTSGHADDRHLVGDMPTPDEHQALEWAELAASDVNDDFLLLLILGMSFYLDGHIVDSFIGCTMTIQLANRVVCQPALGYEGAGTPHPGDHIAGKLQSHFASMFSCIFKMINQISLFIPNWMPRSPNKYAGFVFPWWVDGSLQYTADFEQMRGARIFPIAHEYFQHTWPLQQLSMGDQIDEWMEEKDA
ncbi:hypothetical protein F5141DRAFT_1060138 [Pisolithus sp. B1]|nr:hypothetical protein F5141DRAFT_1060138 [Pisolithus sp. B1]